MIFQSFQTSGKSVHVIGSTEFRKAGQVVWCIHGCTANENVTDYQPILNSLQSSDLFL